MKYDYVLWDWNGTILDDLDATLFAVNDLLAVYGLPPMDHSTYYSYIDTPIYKFYEHIFDLNVVTMEMIKPLYGKFYADHENDILLAAGAEDTVKVLNGLGVKQFILSAAHVDELTKYAKKLGVLDLFQKIDASPDFDAGSKIDRAKLLMANENIRADRCVMVGDTLHDLDTANAIGVDCILYSKGHTDLAALLRTGKPVCHTFEEIKNLILE